MLKYKIPQIVTLTRHLPQSARNHLNIFIKNTRKFLVLHNTEIYENNK